MSTSAKRRVSDPKPKGRKKGGTNTNINNFPTKDLDDDSDEDYQPTERGADQDADSTDNDEDEDENEDEDESDESTNSVFSPSRSSLSAVSSNSPGCAFDIMLRASQSKLSRERKVSSNLPGGSRKKGRSKCDPSKKNVSPEFRVKEFPNHSLVVHSGELFCNCCTVELSRKKSTVSNHIKSVGHAEKLKAYIAKTTASQVYAEKLLKRVITPEIVRPVNTDVYMQRVRVTRVLASEGIALEKMRKDDNEFRLLLEEGSKCTLPMSQLAELIPTILEEEITRIREELLEASDVSITLDCTSEVAEIFSMIVRFVSRSKVIKQRLVSFKLLEKSLTGEQIGNFCSYI